MAENKQTLNAVKEEYAILMKKHTLPSFDELNTDFSVEKVVETETDFLIREIRKSLGDKMLGYLRFIESLLNPVNAPMFVFSIVKLLDAEEKKKLSEIYTELAKVEIKFIELDIEFNEKKEAEFITESYVLWQKIKKKLLEIIDKVGKKWDDKSEGNNRGYFG